MQCRIVRNETSPVVLGVRAGLWTRLHFTADSSTAEVGDNGGGDNTPTLLTFAA